MSEGEELYLTPEGAETLREELKVLTGQRRSELAARLRHAVQQGDLSENADYIAAKEEQAFLEGRIQELEYLLKEAIIVEGTANSDIVDIGSTVVVAENGRAAETFKIVGVKEANPAEGRISHKSPIGRSLLGKSAGEQVVAQTPGGELIFKILEIR